MAAANRTGWIKRRARRLETVFGISRPLAVISAADDWGAFAGRREAIHPANVLQKGRAEAAIRPVGMPSWRGCDDGHGYQRGATHARSCDELGLCQLHATGRRRCDACPYQHIPRNAPPFAPGVIDGPHRLRRGWRAALRGFARALTGRAPW